MATITLEGNEIHTVGELPAVGSDAPAFTLTNNDMGETTLADYAGKKTLLNIVPSLDTDVCAASTRKFNQSFADRDDAVALVVSADLPFASGRFCTTEGLKNVAAGASAIGFGFVNDRIGGKKTIAITLVFLIVTTVLAFVARDRTLFWVAAILLGLMVGPNQAASRALLGSFVPESKQGELFGFYAFSGKLASALGPLSYGLVLGWTESHRWALASIVVFFIAGLALLARVDEAEGIALASGEV